MKKNICLIIFIIIVFPLLSGCWSSKEPKTLAIAESCILDKTPDGSYKVVVEIMNPAGLGGAGIIGGGSGGKNPYITITGVGPSIREAISDQSLNREFIDFGAHIKARFFTESFARDGIVPMLDMIAREHLTDEKPILVVIESDEPEEVYNSMISLSSMVGDYMDDLKQFQPGGTERGVFVTTLDFIKDYYTEGKEPVTGLIHIVESTDKPSGNNIITSQDSGSSFGAQSSKNNEIIYEGLAAFKGDKLAGFMDGEEARVYNFLEDKVQAGKVTVPIGEDKSKTVVNVTESNTDIKTNLVNGKAVVDIMVKASGVVSEEGEEIDVTKPKGLKTVQDAFDAEMEKEISEAVNKAQTEFRSDIFGFGQYMHIQHPGMWKNIKDNWNDDYFAEAQVNITVDLTIALTGEEEKPFSMEGAD